MRSPSPTNWNAITTSTNDSEQTGAYVFYALDRALRSAGSGFVESAYVNDRGVLGCRLNVAGILPRATTLPAPFGSAAFLASSSDLRVAPLLIAKGQSQSVASSDVLVVMGGSGAAGGVSRQVTGGGSATTLALDTSVGFLAGDLALVSQSGVTDCLLEQVSSISAPTLALGGTYYTAGTTTTLATLASSTSTYLTPLGNAAANNLQLTLMASAPTARSIATTCCRTCNWYRDPGTTRRRPSRKASTNCTPFTAWTPMATGCRTPG
jgi:type IV pilus assembly protein PilW